MNLSEAIKKLKNDNELCLERCEGECEDYNYKDGKCYCADSIIVRALEEYIKIGTVEECREAWERQRVKDIIHNPDGGVDEDWLCPSCGRFCSPYTEHCQHCGQAVKVGENP